MTDITDDDDQMLATGAGPGRTTLYTEELGNRVCELLAEGKTLTRICKENPDLPSDRTIRRWALDLEHPFSPQYARAREIGYHAMADDYIDIGDAVSEDAAAVAKARLRAESRKWLLSKALPKIYGDKLELSGNVNHTHEDRLRELEEMERAAAGAGDKGGASDTRH
jgi:hypothetical protein